MTLPDRVGGILVERAADAVAAAPAGVSAGKPAGGRLPVPANQRAVRPAQRRGGLAAKFALKQESSGSPKWNRKYYLCCFTSITRRFSPHTN